MGLLVCFLVVLLGRRSRTAMEMLARDCLWVGQAFALGFFFDGWAGIPRPYTDFAMWRRVGVWQFNIMKLCWAWRNLDVGDVVGFGVRAHTWVRPYRLRLWQMFFARHNAELCYFALECFLGLRFLCGVGVAVCFFLLLIIFFF